MSEMEYTKIRSGKCYITNSPRRGQEFISPPFISYIKRDPQLNMLKLLPSLPPDYKPLMPALPPTMYPFPARTFTPQVYYYLDSYDFKHGRESPRYLRSMNTLDVDDVSVFRKNYFSSMLTKDYQNYDQLRSSSTNVNTPKFKNIGMKKKSLSLSSLSNCNSVKANILFTSHDNLTDVGYHVQEQYSSEEYLDKYSNRFDNKCELNQKVHLLSHDQKEKLTKLCQDKHSPISKSKYQIISCANNLPYRQFCHDMLNSKCQGETHIVQEISSSESQIYTEMVRKMSHINICQEDLSSDIDMYQGIPNTKIAARTSSFIKEDTYCKNRSSASTTDIVNRDIYCKKKQNDNFKCAPKKYKNTSFRKNYRYYSKIRQHHYAPSQNGLTLLLCKKKREKQPSHAQYDEVETTTAKEQTKFNLQKKKFRLNNKAHNV